MLTAIVSIEELETVCAGTFLKKNDSQVTEGSSQFCNLAINFVKLWLNSALVDFIILNQG